MDGHAKKSFILSTVPDKQNIIDRISKKLNLKTRKAKLGKWEKMLNVARKKKPKITIGVLGKYFSTGKFVLSDVYISVIEAIKHAGWANNIDINLEWIDSEEFEENPKKLKNLSNYRGIVVPGGFGSRGIEGIIRAIQYIRENKIPYLGLCYGMQLASVEFARHVAGFSGANTTEIEKNTKYPVIHIMPEQEKKLLKDNYGGTMRLGNYKAKLRKNTICRTAYGKKDIVERHRHRYEFNNKYRKKLEKAGLVVAGISPDNHIVEIIELPKKVHPYFMGVQFHPEFKSWPTRAHPLFREFIKTAKSIDKKV